MYNSAATGHTVATGNSDSRQLLASELRALITQIETTMRLIEATMVQEAGGDQPGSAEVVVLDDVTPRYAAANAALSACKSSVDAALKFLMNADVPTQGADAATAATRRPDLVA
jgi:hypothetical protein